jgi:hypothetical protein
LKPPASGCTRRTWRPWPSLCRMSYRWGPSGQGAPDQRFWQQLAKTEDGHFIPPRKDSAGRYHVDGEISCAPPETQQNKKLINRFPWLRKFADIPKIILFPVPRCLYAHHAAATSNRDAI